MTRDNTILAAVTEVHCNAMNTRQICYSECRRPRYRRNAFGTIMPQLDAKSCFTKRRPAKIESIPLLGFISIEKSIMVMTIFTSIRCRGCEAWAASKQPLHRSKPPSIQSRHFQLASVCCRQLEQVSWPKWLARPSCRSSSSKQA
jgi:hypothetical protein